MAGIAIVSGHDIDGRMGATALRGMIADFAILDDFAFNPRDPIDRWNELPENDPHNSIDAITVKFKKTKFEERKTMRIWIACSICRKREADRTIRGQSVCNICRPRNIRR